MTAGRHTIGEFARLSRLTVHTLRHYDEVGVLRPAFVDPVTGYRSYDEGQLAWALQLGVLRLLGMPLAEVRRIGDGAVALRDALLAHRRRLLDEIGDRERALRLVDALAADGAEPTFRVDVGTAPARTVWSARADCGWTRLEAVVRHALARLTVAARRADRPVAARGALFPLEVAEHVAVVAFVEVARGGYGTSAGDEVPRPFTPLELAGGPVLFTEHVGDHGLLGYAYRALLTELSRRSDAVSGGAAREVYTVAADGRPVTRVSVPLPG